LLEGVRLVQDALDAGVRLETLVYAPERLASTAAGRALRQRLDHMSSAEELDEGLLNSLSETVTSQGVLAAAAIPTEEPLPVGGMVLVLDGISDPGNAGAIVRTARAAGVTGLISTPTTTDLWGPKAMRAGMGAQFHVPARDGVVWPEVPAAAGDRPLCLADAREGAAYWELDWTLPRALVIGSEAHGATTPLALENAERVRIPMERETESLNAAAAAAILMYHALYQRSAAGAAPSTSRKRKAKV
jgi:TrmH family RNA methyltransferase